MESPYVHRGTAYVTDLKKYCWAYENSPRIPTLKYTQQFVKKTKPKNKE